ncbi:hypothetical protein PHYBOEH_008156 [Phytophthora boehmeriae]|uniref:C2 domain-containing protein n=1 Tax=Phytophthora boehmeriae TaxID=109152 RepID=A0A8T1W276_9STRA|nr:hypothetical protein PHYBOEH_008156 [Phytophthora boehmeriae]
MELRFRGKKSAEDANSVVLCDGPKKRRVVGNKSQSLTSAASEWELESDLEDEDLHFMNESTGLVVPRDETLGKYISDRDVIRLCSTEELGTLLEKFSTRDQEVAAEMMNPQKAGTSIGAALSRLKKISATNPTLKKIQKTLEERTSPHAAKAEDAHLPDHFAETHPIFENGDIEEVTGDYEKFPKACDMCEVSWPDDETCSMYRWTKLGIITHHGCVQFTADVLAKHPEITSRDEFLAKSSVTANLNKPGTFYVSVHRAMELPGTQLIGKPAPYVRLSLLPWKEPLQTKPVENGGRNPAWDSVHENEMQFSHMYNSTITPIPLLEVDVYNYNYIADDQIACTLLDMSPLLRFPNIEVKRWFTLSSRALLTQSTGQPRIMLGIKFVATEGEIKAANKHKFRVHQLKSIGLAIPNCAICDRSIMNALKSVWGYRRALKVFQGIDAEYASVISWKNKKKSAVCFAAFIYACVFADFEYALSLLKRGDSSSEMLVPLSSFSKPGSAGADSTDNLSQDLEKQDGDYLLIRAEFQAPEGSRTPSCDKITQSERDDSQAYRTAVASKMRSVTRVERNFSEFVCENMVEKEKSKTIGVNLLDAFWKVKDTIRQLQNEIGRACGALACAENLLNWTHPWKTATAFAVVTMLMLVFSVVRGRWAILFFGMTEFGAVFVDDAPASKRARKILGNYLSSLPTDQDLIELYDPERAVYLKKCEAMRVEGDELSIRLRHHALWTGTISSRAEGDRYSKNYFVVYQPYRFLLWKSEDDAEEGAQAHFQLLFEKPTAVTDKADEKMDAFQVSGVSGSGAEETRVFTFDTQEKRDELLKLVRQSCKV